MLRGVNRILTGLAGAVLVALGAAVLIGSLDLQRRWGFTLPSAWPFDAPGDVLLGRADRRKWRAEGWWWPAVIAALAVVVLLALWWLLAQLRRGRLREVLVDSGDGEAVVVRGSALEEVLAAEAESSAGVERALVVLRGRRVAPEVRVGLTLGPHGSPEAAVRGLSAEVLAHARESTGVERIPAEVRVGVVRHRAERVG
ncbi:alkaline shock response membrane anchor protein AmaP [Streptomyces sp. HU2014]|uniref:alkaline shock response membrane anchor protein AmaP n=1 Tax=Streptomyces TaxID=1883 RepID=UPI000B451E91|nr:MULTISPECIES: alkaline shock response membrane anchor protein AmaP [Streptomyces]UQI44240.1 alkaline shock response membrane anchor protein AmaP [Streptomyces sp. HU2014]